MHEIRKKCNKRWKKSTELQINNHLFGIFVKAASDASVTNSAVMLYLSKRYKRYKRYTFLSLKHVCAYS